MDNSMNAEVTLKQICQEMKLDPRLARMLLRDAAKDKKRYPNLSENRAVRAPWSWPSGSKGLNEALTVLKTE